MRLHPDHYTRSTSVGFPTPSYPAERFVAEVARQLGPLGYVVTQSHDGAGMYATVEISWAPKPSLSTRKPRPLAR